MTLDDSDVGSLSYRASQLPSGDLQVTAYEEAVRAADSRRDLQLMFSTRLELIRACAFGGRSEKSFPAISWCLSQYQQDRERYRLWSFSLLWSYKYLLHAGSTFPQISNEQFEQICDQAAELYRAEGYNMRPIHYIRFTFYADCGNREKASELFPKWRTIPRDYMADCKACETDGCVEYYGLIGKPEKMVLTAQPSLLGHQTCAEVPHRTFAYVLQPLAKLGRYDEAEKFQRNGYRLIRGKPDFIRHLGLHLAFLIHRQELRKATAVFEQHLGIALSSLELRNKCFFYSACGVLLRALAKTRSKRKLRLPTSFPLYQQSDTYDVTALIGWFDQQAGELARRLDERNGNDFHSRELPQLMAYDGI